MTTVPPTSQRTFRVADGHTVLLPNEKKRSRPRQWGPGALIYESDFNGELDKLESFLESGRIVPYTPETNPLDAQRQAKREQEQKEIKVATLQPAVVDRRRNLDPASLQSYLDAQDLDTLNTILTQRCPNQGPMGDCQQIVDFLTEFHQAKPAPGAPDLGVSPATPLEN